MKNARCLRLAASASLPPPRCLRLAASASLPPPRCLRLAAFVVAAVKTPTPAAPPGAAATTIVPRGAVHVFTVGAGHVDGRVTRQTLPGGLEWLWQG